jgi:RimJ/RimL family protein N-acetyltransferase
MVLETDRLLLMPMTIDFIDGLIDGGNGAYELFDIRPSEEWPSDEIFNVLPMIKESLLLKKEQNGFNAWIFVDKFDRSIVGDGGFKGEPNENGEIEIGYGIVKSKRRRGYAFEAVSELIRWGFSNSNVKYITADCLNENEASINLIKKLGMEKTKMVGGLSYFILQRC